MPLYWPLTLMSSTGGGPAQATLIGSLFSATDGTTYTTSTLTFGTETDRRIVVTANFIAGAGIGSPSSFAIGDDSSPTNHVDSGSSTARAFIYVGNPTTNTGTVSVTMPATMVDGVLCVYKVTNLVDPSTPVSAGVTTSGDPITATVTVPASGCLISTAMAGNAIGGTYTWLLNGASVTEQDSGTPDSRLASTIKFDNSGAVMTGVTLSAEHSGTPTNPRLTYITFR